MLKEIRSHIVSWAEAYFWAPLSLGAIPLMALLAYFLTGRATQENLDWLVDLAGRVFTVITATVLLSIIREASGIWWTKEELREQPFIYLVSNVTKVAMFLALMYFLTH